MIFFKILWIINALAAMVILWFFITGLMDGSVSHRNIKLWLFIITAVAAILYISILLQQHGYNKSAVMLSLILAIPAIGYGLFVLLAIFNKGKWN